MKQKSFIKKIDNPARTIGVKNHNEVSNSFFSEKHYYFAVLFILILEALSVTLTIRIQKGN